MSILLIPNGGFYATVTAFWETNDDINLPKLTCLLIEVIFKQFRAILKLCKSWSLQFISASLSSTVHLFLWMSTIQRVEKLVWFYRNSFNWFLMDALWPSLSAPLRPLKCPMISNWLFSTFSSHSWCDFFFNMSKVFEYFRICRYCTF